MDPRDWLFDRRIIRRNLENGVLPMDQYEKYLSELTDTAKEAEPVEVSLCENPEQEDNGEEKEKEQGDDVLTTDDSLTSFHGVLDE